MAKQSLKLDASKFLKSIDNASRRIKDNSEKAVEEAGGDFFREILQRAPQDEGTLFDSVTLVPGQDNRGHYIDVVIDKKAFYWRFLEYGTVFIEKRPFVRPARAKVAKNWRSGKYKPVLPKRF